VWSVSEGTIVKGQGTPTVEVAQPNFHEKVVATVTIKGLLVGCPNSASAEYQLIIDPGPIKIGEMSDTTNDIDKELLAKIKKVLREQPYAQLYVVLQFKRNTSQNTKRLIKQRFAARLTKIKIDATRITFELADNDNRGVLFWLVPPGAGYPYVDK